jgi:predicted nucleic acid-binding protein
MRLVLDASVAMSAVRPTEPVHATSGARVERALQALDELVVSSLFAVEVTDGLARLGFSRCLVRTFMEPSLRRSHEVVTIGPRRATKAARLACSCTLRGADPPMSGWRCAKGSRCARSTTKWPRAHRPP